MNYLVPLMIGAEDMAFPRLNAFSFWIAPPAAVLLLSSLALGGFDTGWTGYPPLSARAPVGMQMFFLGVFVAGWSSILGALNLIVTVLRLRAKGMTAFRLPIFVWAAVATSHHFLDSTQLIGLSFQLVMLQRLFGMGFFDPLKGGNPVLFQHLFWFYSHPAVYVFVLPGLGIISELLPVFARKPLFGYKWVAMSSSGDCSGGFPGLGAPYVHFRDERVSTGAIHVQHVAGGGANRGEVLLLGGDAVEGEDRNANADVVCSGWPGGLPDRRFDRSSKCDGLH